MSKKSVLTGMLLLGIAIHSAAQLKVFSNGNMGIDAGAAAPASALKVGTINTDKAIEVVTKNSGISVVRRGVMPAATGGLLAPATWSYTVSAKNSINFAALTSGLAIDPLIPIAPATNINSVSVFGSTLPEQPKGYVNTGKAWGVLGIAGGATSGYNYGVMGVLGNGREGMSFFETTLIQYNGAGIVGSVSSTVVQIPGRYAGYFVGNVRITGTVTNGTALTISDIRYKRYTIQR